MCRRMVGHTNTNFSEKKFVEDLPRIWRQEVILKIDTCLCKYNLEVLNIHCSFPEDGNLNWNCIYFVKSFFGTLLTNCLCLSYRYPLILVTYPNLPTSVNFCFRCSKVLQRNNVTPVENSTEIVICYKSFRNVNLPYFSHIIFHLYTLPNNKWRPMFSILFYSILLWLYSPLLGLGRFFSFLIYTQSVGLLGRGISQSQGCYLHAEQHKHTINAYRDICLEWDSNPRLQCLSGRRQFMP
jgi:hypothetical protein